MGAPLSGQDGRLMSRALQRVRRSRSDPGRRSTTATAGGAHLTSSQDSLGGSPKCRRRRLRRQRELTGRAKLLEQRVSGASSSSISAAMVTSPPVNSETIRPSQERLDRRDPLGARSERAAGVDVDLHEGHKHATVEHQESGHGRTAPVGRIVGMFTGPAISPSVTSIICRERRRRLRNFGVGRAPERRRRPAGSTAIGGRIELQTRRATRPREARRSKSTPHRAGGVRCWSSRASSSNPMQSGIARSRIAQTIAEIVGARGAARPPAGSKLLVAGRVVPHQSGPCWREAQWDGSRREAFLRSRAAARRHGRAEGKFR